MNNSIYRKRYRLISTFLITLLLTGCSSSQLSLGNKESDDSDEEISTNEKDTDNEAANEASTDDDSTKDSSTEENSSEELLVDSVTWDDSYAPMGSDDDYNKVYFNMSDGSIQTFEISSYYMIEDLEMVDLNNDGTDDYIINTYFANTATEYNIIYAYTFEDGEVSQLFPVSGIEGVDDEELYDCQIEEITIDYSNDEVVNGLKLTSYGKVGAMAYEETEREIFLQDGSWNLYYSFDNTYGAYYTYTAPRGWGSDDIDEKSKKLYEDFFDGSEKATFDQSGDCGQYVALSDVLTDGKSYTLDEIKELLTSEDQYGDGWEVENINRSTIDCGLDGDIEMLVNIDFDSEFSLDMVIKNIDGSLVICFAADSWSRSETNLLYNGVTYSYGSGGASSHGGENGFIDADGKYVLWYYEWEEGLEAGSDGTVSMNYYKEDGSYDTVTVEIPENTYLYQERIAFSDADSDEYYYFYLLDEDYNEIPDDACDPDNPYDVIRKAHEEAGIKVITPDESDELIEERRLEIGLTDDIFDYGSEYLPDDE